jgi:hypothetical protein
MQHNRLYGTALSVLKVRNLIESGLMDRYRRPNPVVLTKMQPVLRR